ncbi:hypothetical protein DICSQDRAFT_140034 [Dichomitus squalens LYAD-421 SS1]|uniref:Uncharacterized protein n=1 Tax=Dichomitus squalens (strain LYAD-421) TaxID=732165 RepID=R7SPT9_DICSQ|nr:uncharacterized protein DICSQDRAFT_140034 [Dichomitus squalens LYAD-421 SS1]EJF57745.1 hypothetical protein DICSQDRAFT_140034 [Dichomitus squalens LYAD-421 SS1]
MKVLTDLPRQSNSRRCSPACGAASDPTPQQMLRHLIAIEVPPPQIGRSSTLAAPTSRGSPGGKCMAVHMSVRG